jgi:Holliday junction resolvase-like predicted endonuclease
MFVRLREEKVSADNYRAIKKKEQKRVLKTAKLNTEKDSSDYCQVIEKAKSMKSKRTEEMEHD